MNAVDLADKMDRDQAGFWEIFNVPSTGLQGFKLVNLHGKVITILFLLNEEQKVWKQYSPEELQAMLDEHNQKEADNGAASERPLDTDS